jgi:hypothetical protein
MSTFPEYLLQKGRITESEFKAACSRTRKVNVRIGDCAYAFGFMDSLKVSRVLGMQQRCGRKFGEIAVALEYLTDGQLRTLLRIQERYRVSIEDSLIQAGALTEQELENERSEYLSAAPRP